MMEVLFLVAWVTLMSLVLWKLSQIKKELLFIEGLLDGLPADLLDDTPEWPAPAVICNCDSCREERATTMPKKPENTD